MSRQLGDNEELIALIQRNRAIEERTMGSNMGVDVRKKSSARFFLPIADNLRRQTRRSPHRALRCSVRFLQLCFVDRL
jgi:hypothetical protein